MPRSLTQEAVPLDRDFTLINSRVYECNKTTSGHVALQCNTEYLLKDLLIVIYYCYELKLYVDLSILPGGALLGDRPVSESENINKDDNELTYSYEINSDYS